MNFLINKKLFQVKHYLKIKSFIDKELFEYKIF